MGPLEPHLPAAEPLRPPFGEIVLTTTGTLLGARALSGDGPTGTIASAAAASDSSTGSKLLDALGISKDVADMISFASDLVTYASYVKTAIEFGTKVGESLGWLTPDPDPLTVILRHLDHKLDVQLSATLAVGTALTMQNLAAEEARARTSLEVVAAWLRGGRRQDAASASLAQADFNSRLALNTVMNDRMWLRPFSVEAIDGPWLKGEGPWYLPDRAPVEQGLVWDYRLALPTFLYALSARMSILKLVDEHFARKREHYNELYGYGVFVDDLGRRLQEGIRRTRDVPDDAAIFARGFPSGAVLIYSGLSFYDDWWSPYRWDFDPEFTTLIGYRIHENKAEFDELNDIHREYAYWKVYRALNIGKLRLLAWQLLELADGAKSPYTFVKSDAFQKVSDLVLFDKHQFDTHIKTFKQHGKSGARARVGELELEQSPASKWRQQRPAEGRNDVSSVRTRVPPET